MSFGMQGGVLTGTLAYHVPYDLIESAMTVVGGTPEIFTLPGGVTITRIVPMRHPVMTNILADRVYATARGAPSGGDYEFFELVVDFISPQFDLGGNEPFMTVTGNPVNRITPLPASAVQFADSSHPVNDVGLPLPGADFTVTLHKQPAFDPQLYNSYFGYVNSVPFMGWPAGTVLFDGLGWSRQTTFGGVSTWQTNLVFRASSPDFTWNQKIKRDGTIAAAFRGGTTDPLHPSTDLYTLLV